jgi:hypothetical protein
MFYQYKSEKGGKMINSKKGMDNWVIIGLILAIVAFVLFVLWYFGVFGDVSSILDIFTPKRNALSAVAQGCQVACTTKNAVSFCSQMREVDNIGVAEKQALRSKNVPEANFKDVKPGAVFKVTEINCFDLINAGLIPQCDQSEVTTSTLCKVRTAVLPVCTDQVGEPNTIKARLCPTGKCPTDPTNQVLSGTDAPSDKVCCKVACTA